MIPPPSPRTTTFGRAADVGRVRAALDRGDPLVSLIGLGGVGKSRLALVAVEGRTTPVAYCDATGLVAEGELVTALAIALGGIPREAGAPIGPWSALAARVTAGTLVVIDNLEELVPIVASPLRRWLEQAPGLQLLVTSRAPLRVPEETVIALGPLALGPESSAVALLMDRSRTAPGSPWRTDQAALERLARRLDGMPLALELAAARSSQVMPATLEALLGASSSPFIARDVRQRSCEAAVDWSWQRLGPDEQAALIELAALGSCCDLELAAVALGRAPLDALRILAGLADVGLVASDGGCHRVLETVREFVLPRDPTAFERVAERVLAAVEATTHGLARTPGPRGAALVGRARELYFALLRRGMAGDDIGRALVALRHMVPVHRGTIGVEAMLVPAIELVLRADDAPLAERAAVAYAATHIAVTCGDSERAWALDACLARWPAGSPLIVLSRLFIHFEAFRMDAVVAFADAILAAPCELEVRVLATLGRCSARRALGVADVGANGQLLDTLFADVEAVPVLAAFVQSHRALHALHSGDGESALIEATRGIALAERAGDRIHRMTCLRVRARALRELGAIAAAAAELDALLAGPELVGRDRNETILDRAAMAIDEGRPAAARLALERAEVRWSTPFERSYHAALTAIAGRFEGIERAAAVDSDADLPAIGTIEDATVSLLRACAGPSSLEARRAAEAIAPWSYRARQALRWARAIEALAGDGRGVLALSSDGAAFRCGPAWIDLGTKDLLRELLTVLVDSALERRGGGLTVEALCAHLWPGERIALEFHERPLQVAVSALRKLGLGPILEFNSADGGGYRISPSVVVVRVARSAFPGERAAAVPPTRVSRRPLRAVG